MATRNAEQPPVSKGIPTPPPLPLPSPVEQLRSRVCNTVFKTGPLFISSKGIGWTSWKKRWFILTRTSLVFFRSDPSAVPQKGSEVNLTLGGIDLNNSGSVIVKEDKKLLTVSFPDGREGRTFTLKAETLQELLEWKTALESALAQAPNNPTSQNASDQSPVKVSVVGRPVLLALEDADGTPSFLEKALQFIEEHGVKTEGILRQAADVDDVERRIHEYEEGKNEFSSGEDAHVIGDCIKYILREMPSSPIPASCCKALLQACRSERSYRVNAMRTAICETFPEPNRRLLQRILTMMKKIVVHKAENRMSCSAAAACMAPLLLRPLLAGECEIDSDFDLGGDGSVQLIQAAAAANHAQAIVITLLDEYDKIFGEGSASPEPYTDSEESGSESEEGSYEDDENDDGSGPLTDDDPENASSVTCSGSGDSRDNSLCDDEGSDGSISGSDTLEVGNNNRLKKNSSSSSFETPSPEPDVHIGKEASSKAISGSKSIAHLHAAPVPISIQKSTTISNGPVQSTRNRSTWGRTPGRKKLSMESIDYSVEEEAEIQSLEITKSELENKIMEEVKENVVLQTNLEIRKKDLQRRRQALEQEVAQLQERLQKERDRRAALEAGLHMSHEPLPNLDNVDEKTKADLEEIAVAEADVLSLTQKLGELGKHLLHGAVPKPRSSPHKTRVHQTKLYRIDDKQNDEASSRSHFERNTDSNLGGTEIETESKVESTHLSNKNLPQIHKTGSLRTRSYRYTEASGDSSTSKPSVSRRSSGKRSVTTKVEGTVSTNTALTKLTTRLNFLKERRNQIAHELQTMDTVRGSPRSGENSEKSQGSEVETESQLPQNPEIRSQSLIYSDGNGKRSESQSSHGFDRGKSENHLAVNIDKGRGVEGQQTVTSRTSNR